MSDALSKCAKSFEEGAVAYERLRPQFPNALFDDLVTVAGERLHRVVLEIGAGTGRATLPLARRGARIRAVEPSADMLRVLAHRLEDEGLQDAVELQRAAFEDVGPEEGPFGIVIAAQSFHWTDPHTRWPRLAGLLGQDGIAFLFWNDWQLDSELHHLDAVQAVYSRAGSGLTPDIDDQREELSWAEREISEEPFLQAATATTYSWDRALSAADYFALLATTSQYAVADPDERSQLFKALGPVLGDTVRLHGTTLLLTTRPAPARADET